MRVHELEVASIHTPDEVVRFLRKNDVQKGDKLKVLTQEETGGLAMIAVIIIIAAAINLVLGLHNKTRRVEDGEKILGGLFKGETIDDIESQIKNEYGITVEVAHTDKEDEDRQWRNLSAQNFLKGYDINEPEYFEADIKEPNVEYKAWKDK